MVMMLKVIMMGNNVMLWKMMMLMAGMIMRCGDDKTSFHSDKSDVDGGKGGSKDGKPIFYSVSST